MVEILSLHVPKTAGTSFWRILTQVYSSDEIYRDVGANSCQADDPILEKIKVLHTHYAISKYSKYFLDSKKIVWLRHPVFRVVSDYFFSKNFNDRNNPMHVEVVDNNLSLLEYARRSWAQNIMYKFIDGMDLKEFYFVGIQEFYEEDLADLKQMLSWSDFSVSARNTNPDPNYYSKLEKLLSDRKLMNQLASLNSKDIILYENALRLRAERKQEPYLLQCTGAEWNRLQFMFEQMKKELSLK